MMRTWAAENGLEFSPDAAGFTAPRNPSRKHDASDIGKHSAKAISVFTRLIGLSKIQSAFPQFASNRFRGDWQSDRNICWGSYKGHTVIVWDTIYYDLNSNGGSDIDWSEGEYSSILVLTETAIQPTLITPNSLGKRLSALGIEEGRGMLKMSTVKFELNAFNKAYQVRSTDQKWAFAIIDQAMMEWLMQNKKHTMELAPGGTAVSTWFTLSPEQFREQLDFCIEFLGRFPEDLQASPTSDETA